MRNCIRCIIGLFVGFLLASPVVEAQPSRLVRVGWLTTGPHPFIETFRQGLRALGWLRARISSSSSATPRARTGLLSLPRSLSGLRLM